MIWLDDALIFPHPILRHPDGLLAVGDDLSTERLLLAYRWGIFPWFEEGDPVLWWWTAPRPVVAPSRVHVSASLRKVIRRNTFHITINTAFSRVIRACAATPRPGQHGTWITEDMIAAYTVLHEQGYAHSVEVWSADKEDLVGGLYGIGMGQIFFGESMFSRASNASKAGFVHLAEVLDARGVVCIDCQQDTPHMRSMGAGLITESVWLDRLRANHRYMLCNNTEKLVL